MQKQWLYKISSVVLIVILALIVLPVIPAHAGACISIASGNWNAPLTWSAGCTGSGGIPAAADTVTVDNGHIVTVNVSASPAILNINAGGTLDIQNAISVNGATTIDGELKISNTTGTKIFKGLVTINSTGSWNSTVSESVNFQGGLTHNGTSFTDGVSTYTFNTNSQAIGGTSAISINSVTAAGADVTNNGTLTVVTTLTVTGVNFNNNSTLTVGNSLTGTGTLIQGVNAVLNIGNGSGITGLDASTNTPNTVNYYRASTQTIHAGTYHHLTISGTSNKTISASGGAPTGVTVNGIFSREGTAAISTNDPAYGPSATLQYKGSAAQTTGLEFVTPFTSSGGVIIDNISGVTLGASKTIDSTLTFTNGLMTTGANTITIGSAGTVTGADVDEYINGNLQKVFPTADDQIYTFDIGDAFMYTPVAFTGLDAGTGGNITAATTASEHLVIANSKLNSTKDVNRYWTLTSAGGLVFANANVTFNFVSGDVDGGAVTSSFDVKRYSGGVWSSVTTDNKFATSTRAAGLSALGDFAIGEPAGITPILTLPGTNPLTVNENTLIILDDTAAVSDDSSDFNTGILDVQVTDNAETNDVLRVSDDNCTVGTDIIEIVATDVRRCTAFPTSVSIGTLSGSDTNHLTVTFNANATPAYVQDVIRHLEFRTDSNPYANQRTVTFTVSDGTNASAAVTKLVNVTAINNAPTVGAWNAVLSYTEAALAIDIDTNVNVSDVDIILKETGDRNLTTGVMTVSFSANGDSFDQLDIRNQGVTAGLIGVNGSNVTYGGVTIGTFAGGTNGSALVITFNSNATNAGVQALARKITYRNVSDNPSTLARSILMQVTDGVLPSVSVTTATINVTALPNSASFNKSAPLYGAYGQSATPLLTWGASAGATSYAYCVDQTNNNICDSDTWVSTGLTQSATPLGLALNNVYYWQVRASGGPYANAGSWWVFSTQSGAFNKTAPVYGAAGQSATPTLTWGTSAGATTYEYCVDDSNNNTCNTVWVDTVGATSVVIPTLTADTTYYWQVRALSSGAAYTYSNAGTWWTFSRLSGSFNKIAPLYGALGQSATPTLTWGVSAGATSYAYCIGTISGSCNVVDWTDVGNVTSTTSANLSADIPYYWQVRAVSSGTAYTYANTGVWWTFSRLSGSFNKIAPIYGAFGQPATPSLTWGVSAGATSYEYCVDDSNNNACAGDAWVSTGMNTSVVIPALPLNTTYYWQVRALSSGAYTYANAGTWWTFSRLPGAFNKTAPGYGVFGQSATPTLTWGVSAGATSYAYCIGTISGSCNVVDWTDVGNVTSTTSGNLSTDTTYYWQVRAVSSGTAYTYANAGTWWTFSRLPGAFNKTTPGYGVFGQSATPTLTWGVSAGATSYAYCVGTISGSCNVVDWTDVGNVTSTTSSVLSADTIYYWQVRAVSSGTAYTYANAGSWWTFSRLPGAFNKISPTWGAAGLSTTPTLTWGTSAGATSYAYCIGTSAGSCNVVDWTDVGNVTNYTLLVPLSANTTYYWQVRAVSSGTAYTYANANSWWMFKTAP